MSVGLLLLVTFKIVLIVLLCVFLLTIIVTALILLMPIRYNLKLTRDAEMLVDVDLTWFFGIIKFFYSYNSKSSYKLLIFNKLFKRRKRKLDKKKFNKKKNLAKKKTNKKVTPNGYEPGERQNSELNPAKGQNKHESDKDPVNKNPADQTQGIENKNLSQIRNRIKNTFGEITDKIITVKDFPDKMKLLKSTYMLAKRLFAAIKPKKLRLEAVIGFDDPSLTGRFIGALAFFAGINGIDMKLQGNFCESEFKCNAELAGSFTLWGFVWPVIRYALTKPVRKLLFCLKK